ncbi:MAG TPA: hypothetical protein PK514_13020 [Spirochaetota bacterium]|nr:hypothetical protein [Spirochaetota bacterium]
MQRIVSKLMIILIATVLVHQVFNLNQKRAMLLLYRQRHLPLGDLSSGRTGTMLKATSMKFYTILR